MPKLSFQCQVKDFFSYCVLKLKLFELEKIYYCWTSFFAERQECNAVNTTKANMPLSASCQMFSSLQMSFQLILRTMVPPHRDGKITIKRSQVLRGAEINEPSSGVITKCSRARWVLITQFSGINVSTLFKLSLG